MAARFDRSEEIADGFFFKPLECEHLVAVIREVVDRDEIGNPPEIEEELDLLLAESVDVHSMLPDEDLEFSLDLGSTSVTIGTIDCHLPFIALERSTADRTLGRHDHLTLCARTSIRDDAHELRYDLPRSDDEDLVSDPDSFLRELVVVVKRRTRDGDSTHIDGLEQCHRCHDPRAPHRVLDIEKSRADIGRWELVRDRIARVMLGRPELAPEREILELHDESIDLEWKNGTLERESMHLREQRIKIPCLKSVRRRRESERSEERKVVGVGGDS